MSLRLDAIIDSKTLEKSIDKGVQAWNRKRAGSSTLKLKIDEKGFRQPLGRITGDVNMFDDALAASNARVIAFGASTAVIGGISKAFKELAKTTIEVQKSFSEINRILDLSTKKFEKFGNRLFDISKKNATSFQDTTKAALEFARQGLKTEETLKRTADALTLVRLTGINADKAVSSLTATVNAFDSVLVTTSTSLNKFVAVETKFAVGAKDLVEAIGRVGSSAKDAKVGFDELNAMVTSVQQSTGRGGAVIGNAMKTIFTRLQRASTLEALESYNVAVRDIEGNTLPAMRILDNFAQQYKGLADASQGYLREQVAGVFQANILSAVLRDLGKNQSVYGQALKVSTAATNEADDATAKLNQSLSALVTQTGIEFKRLQENIGKTTFEPIARMIMEPLKSAMEGLNELIDGEGVGSDVANGILKGIKNVIGGPGLVAIGGIILKVFYNTVSYMAKALPSLIGMTTETQKRATLEQFIAAALAKESDLAKAVAAAEGNAAEQARLLLGHAKKTSKELDDQEASLQNIVRMMSKTKGGHKYASGAMRGGGRGAGGFIPGMAGEVQDIRRGVGGVSVGSKPVSIPNFAFGGGVRGTMIANTGEYIVPNYSNGGSAIFNPNMVSQYGMPSGARPVRGAGGYVPNFVDVNKLTKFQGRGFGSLSTAEQNELSSLTGRGVATIRSQGVGPTLKQARALGVGQAARAKAGIANTFTTDSIAMLTPPSGIGAGNFGQSNFSAKNTIIPGMPFSVKYPKYTYNPKKSSKKGKNITPIEEHVEDGIIKATQLFTASIKPPAKRLKKGPMKAALNTAQGGAGAISAAAGAAFEVGISQALGLPAAKLEKGKKNLDVPTGMVSASLKELFSGGRTGAMMEGITGADFKVSDSWGNARSMAEKIVAIDRTDFKAFATKRKRRRGARGYVPNFAALGDAVEREAAAGVPLGSIRVNRSSRLASPNNPVGLGVTNTRDEPQGLKDVYGGGARGYIPSFARDIGLTPSYPPLHEVTARKGKGSHQLVIKKQIELSEALDKAIKQYRKGKISRSQLDDRRKELSKQMKLTAAAEKRIEKSVNKRANAVDRLNRNAKPGMMKKFGERLGGFGGMALSFGAPMLAGAIEQGGGPKEASAGLTGVGTGAAFGMMFGPWGTAIGAAVGGIYGFTKALTAGEMSIEEITKARDELKKTTTETTSAARGYVKAQEDLLTANSQQELEDAQKRLAENFDKIKGTALEKKFLAAGTDVGVMEKAIESFNKMMARNIVAMEFAVSMGGMGKKGFVERFAGTDVSERYEARTLKKPEEEKEAKSILRARGVSEDAINEMWEKIVAGESGYEGVRTGRYTAGDTRGVGGTKAMLDFPKIAADVGLRPFFELLFQNSEEDIQKFADTIKNETSDGWFTESEIRGVIRKLPSFQGISETALTSLSSFMNKSEPLMRLLSGAGSGNTGGKGLMIFDEVAGEWKKVPTAWEGIRLAFQEMQKDSKGGDAIVQGIQAEAEQAFTSLNNIKKAMQRLSNVLKKAGKFSEAFQKLNTAYAQIGAGAMKDTGDTLGGIQFKGGRQAAGRLQKRVDYDRDFGIKNQARIMNAFGKSVKRSTSAMDQIQAAVGALMESPGRGLSMLEGSLQGTFAQESFQPEEFEKFKTLVSDLRYTYETQQINNKYADEVAKFNLQVENIKAENLIKEKSIQQNMARMVSEQKVLGKMREGQLSKEIQLIELQGEDPRRQLGLWMSEQMDRGFGREDDIRERKRAIEDSQMRQQNLKTLGDFRVRLQQTALTKRLISVQQKLAEVVQELTRQMGDAAFERALTNPESLLNKRLQSTEGFQYYGSARALAQSGDPVQHPSLGPGGGSVRDLYNQTYGVTTNRYGGPADLDVSLARRGNVKGVSGAGGVGGGSGLTDIQLYDRTLEITKKYADEIAKIETVEGQIAALKAHENDELVQGNYVLKDSLTTMIRQLSEGKKIQDIQRGITDEVRERRREQEKELLAFQNTFKGGLASGFQAMMNDTQTIYGKLGEDLPRAFRDGMVNAMETALDSADSFSDALRGSAIEFLKIIRRASLESAMSNVTALMGMGMSGPFRRGTGNNQRGGIIGAEKGMYISGNRTGDKNPALLEDGEYVLNKKAVKAMGGPSALNNLNFGMAPRFGGGFQHGGSMFLNESVTSPRMSGFFLTSDNPELAEARDEARKKYEERQRKKAEKEAMKKQFLSTLISTGIGMGVSAIGNRMQQRSSVGKMQKMTAGTTNKAGESLEITRGGNFFKGYTPEGSDAALAQLRGQKFLTGTQAVNLGLDPSKSHKVPKSFKRALNTRIDARLEGAFDQMSFLGTGTDARRNFLNIHGQAHSKGKGGGKISGGYINRDSIPAFLSGGEYVMNNRAVRKYGLGFMGRLNGGLIPGFQGGGSVGPESPTPLNAQSATNTNNISINISMGGEGGGSKAGTAEGNENANLESTKDDKTKGKELSERIRAAVVQVISEEQRVGGSLTSTGKGR